MCFFQESVCIPEFILWIAGAIVVIGFTVALIVSKRGESDASMVSHPSGRTEEETDEDDSETPTPKVGGKVLYDTSADFECNLIITKVNTEESDVYGYFEIELPEGAQVINLHYNRDEGQINLSFHIPDKGAKELTFNAEDPDELSDYSVYVDYVGTVTAKKNV